MVEEYKASNASDVAIVLLSLNRSKVHRTNLSWLTPSSISFSNFVNALSAIDSDIVARVAISHIGTPHTRHNDVEATW